MLQSCALAVTMAANFSLLLVSLVGRSVASSIRDGNVKLTEIGSKFICDKLGGEELGNRQDFRTRYTEEEGNGIKDVSNYQL
jgi:hypothetical protein